MSRFPARARAASIAVSTAVSLSIVLSGCTAGPDTGPNVVRGDGGTQASTTENALPGLSAPKKDLEYSPCGRSVTGFNVDIPTGVTVECASFESPVDSQNSNSDLITIGVVRVRSDKTPDDAAPLVLTTGVDLPASRLALNFTGAQSRPLIDKHPVVAVDRRGIGQSAGIDCLTKEQRSTIANDGAALGRDVEARTDALASAARLGADICNDTLTPNQLNYSAAAAAADLERLRSQWEVDRLAIAGVGTGSTVALAYQANNGDHVGRLILDSPVGFNVQAAEAASARADGLQNSLAAFAGRCASAGCAFGADGMATLNRVFTAGAAGSLPDLSDTSILTGVTTALAVDDTSPDGLKKLADAITKADRNDLGPLREIVTVGNGLRESDGQLLSTCNDMVGRPGLDDIPRFARAWSGNASLTAATGALNLARCDGWGVAPTPKAPDSFSAPILLLIGQNDPINGAKAAEAILPALQIAGADIHTVSWDGLGYSVTSRSDCAAQVAADYLGDEPLSGPAERVCPS